MDYDALMDKPLWLLYSYLAQLLDSVKRTQAAQVTYNTPGAAPDDGMTIKELAQVSGVSTPEMLHQGKFEAAVRAKKKELADAK